MVREDVLYRSAFGTVVIVLSAPVSFLNSGARRSEGFGKYATREGQNCGHYIEW